MTAAASGPCLHEPSAAVRAVGFMYEAFSYFSLLWSRCALMVADVQGVGRLGAAVGLVVVEVLPGRHAPDPAGELAPVKRGKHR